MTFSEIGNPSSLSKPVKRRPQKLYDGLAGSAVLRRAGKAGKAAPLRGDPATTILAARARTEPEDRISQQLKDFYQSILREPVPERIVQLVADLEGGRKG